jgi:hypothetical protein
MSTLEITTYTKNLSQLFIYFDISLFKCYVSQGMKRSFMTLIFIFLATSNFGLGKKPRKSYFLVCDITQMSMKTKYATRYHS